MAKSDVLLTASDLLKWREEDKELDDQIRKLQQRRSEVKRKLDAAEVFAEAVSPQDVGGDLAPSDERESEQDSGSAPQALFSNMLSTGESLNVKQIKARLIELGFDEKVRAQPNYHYQTTYRLTKRGKLSRRGTKYRAVPLSSSQEETGA